MANGVTKKGHSRFGRKNGVVRTHDYVCPQCGESFQAHQTDRRYCSRKCYYASKKGREWFSVSDKIKDDRKSRMTGEGNPMWKGGDSDKERRNSQYKNWRIDVFKRDDFTCQWCGYRNGDGTKRKDLNAHHLIPWIKSKHMRYIVDNGVTLCLPCHNKEHSLAS